MDVWIARGGVEIGAFRRQDLADLAKSGHLAQSDYYWHNGKEDWKFLGNLLGADTWKSAEPAASLSKRYRRLAAAGVCAVVFFLGVVALLTHHTQPFPDGHPLQDLSRTDAKLRETAVAELDRIVKKLPRVAAPPSNLFYDALSVTVPLPPGALTAKIAGTEDIVDPVTQKTVGHTPFVLTLAYHDARWMYRDYRASRVDMNDGPVTEIDRSKNAAVQPTIVSILGIKAVPNLIDHQ